MPVRSCWLELLDCYRTVSEWRFGCNTPINYYDNSIVSFWLFETHWQWNVVDNRSFCSTLKYNRSSNARDQNLYNFMRKLTRKYGTYFVPSVQCVCTWQHDNVMCIIKRPLSVCNAVRVFNTLIHMQRELHIYLT